MTDRTKLNELKRKAEQTGRNEDIQRYQAEKRRVEPQTLEGKLAELEQKEQACIVAIERAKELGLTDEVRANESELRIIRERKERLIDWEKVNNPSYKD
jgi:hypothetical protein